MVNRVLYVCLLSWVLTVLIGSADRKVLSPFTFSDGTYVPPGNYIKIAERALMLDSKNYNDPMTFDGFRFVTITEDGKSSQSRFTQPSSTFPFWGSVGCTWYVKFLFVQGY
jgi:hypothetical protein